MSKLFEELKAELRGRLERDRPDAFQLNRWLKNPMSRYYGEDENIIERAVGESVDNVLEDYNQQMTRKGWKDLTKVTTAASAPEDLLPEMELACDPTDPRDGGYPIW